MEVWGRKSLWTVSSPPWVELSDHPPSLTDIFRSGIAKPHQQFRLCPYLRRAEKRLWKPTLRSSASVLLPAPVMFLQLLHLHRQMITAAIPWILRLPLVLLHEPGQGYEDGRQMQGLQCNEMERMGEVVAEERERIDFSRYGARVWVGTGWTGRRDLEVKSKVQQTVLPCEFFLELETNRVTSSRIKSPPSPVFHSFIRIHDHRHITS